MEKQCHSCGDGSVSLQWYTYTEVARQFLGTSEKGYWKCEECIAEDEGRSKCLVPKVFRKAVRS